MDDYNYYFFEAVFCNPLTVKKRRWFIEAYVWLTMLTMYIWPDMYTFELFFTIIQVEGWRLS